MAMENHFERFHNFVRGILPAAFHPESPPISRPVSNVKHAFASATLSSEKNVKAIAPSWKSKSEDNIYPSLSANIEDLHSEGTIT